MFYPTRRQVVCGLLYLIVGHLILLPPLVFQLVTHFFPPTHVLPVFQFTLILITTSFYLFLFWQPLGDGLRKLGKLIPALIWMIPLGYVMVLLLRSVVTMGIIHYYGELNFGANQEMVATVTAQAPYLIAIAAIVLAPLWEEVFFTGLLFSTLRQKSRFLAYLIAPFTFGLLHTLVMFISGFSLLAVLITLVYVPSALVSCRLYEKTGNLWSSILFHSFSNAMAMLAMTLV